VVRMNDAKEFLARHADLTRRFFLRAGAAWAVTSSALARAEPPVEPAKAIGNLEPYFPPPEQFQDVSRGNPLPHSIPDEKRREVGLTRETWRLEIVSDPERPATLGKQF